MMSDEQSEFRGPGDWKSQANKVEEPDAAWDMPEEDVGTTGENPQETPSPSPPPA